jgi:hypothetical protein
MVAISAPRLTFSKMLSVQQTAWLRERDRER